MHATVIPLWIYPIPSDLGSQAELGQTSTTLRNHAGTPGAVVFCFLLLLSFARAFESDLGFKPATQKKSRNKFLFTHFVHTLCSQRRLLVSFMYLAVNRVVHLYFSGSVAISMWPPQFGLWDVSTTEYLLFCKFWAWIWQERYYGSCRTARTAVWYTAVRMLL